MGAIQADITLEERLFIGEDRTINIDVNEADGHTPQTMTGFALTWELKDSITGTVRVTKTVGSGITIGNGDGTDDRAAIALADTDTEGLTAGTLFHHLRRTDAGSELVLAFGNVILTNSGIT